MMSSMKCMKLLLTIMICLMICSQCLKVNLKSAREMKASDDKTNKPEEFDSTEESASDPELPENEVNSESEDNLASEENKPNDNSKNNTNQEMNSPDQLPREPTKKSTFEASSSNSTSIYEVIPEYVLPNGPIYAKGWLKYANFEKDSKAKPKEFLKNMAFYEQMKKGDTVDLTEKDPVGYINVPDEDHFFFILTENSLNVLSSRKNNLAKTFDILNVDEIKRNSNFPGFKGGIEDHGDFLEGYCFQIKSNNGKKKSEIVWELCADSKDEKVTWMNTLVKLVQKVNKKTPSTIAQENNMKNMISSLKQNLSNSTLIQIKSSKNVTWVPISLWSECSKPCGGGKSYLQRLCIAPENSKEKCEGERILTRDCNLHPCGDHGPEEELSRLSQKTNRTVASPMMRYMPISRRPSRYEKCIIKEGDLALFIDQGSIEGAKIPVRVILNNRTLTAYSNDDYESIIVTHRLSTVTGLRKYDKDSSNTCFEIEEGKKKTVLCSFVSNGVSLSDLANEWQKDILDFIKNCANYYSHELDYKEMNAISASQVQNALDFYQDKEKEQMEKIIIKTQQLALQAIEKELKVENLIEKEEEEKQKRLEKEINSEYDKLQKQKEIINQALNEKKKQADIYANKLMIKKKIKQISEQVKREVMKIREDLRARILSKQRDEKRKRDLVMNKIVSLKKDISKDLLKASKNGNSDECNPDRSTNEIIDYCRVNYDKDFVKMNDCVKNDNFCYMCCESEFGDLHLEERSNCYIRCDDFYIYHIKFKTSPKKQKGNLESKNDSEETVNPPINNKKELNENKLDKIKDSKKTKFLETRSSTLIEERSNFEENSREDINKLIEKEKKRELLLKIKEDLSFF